MYCLSWIFQWILRQDSDDDVVPSERQRLRPKTTTILPVTCEGSRWEQDGSESWCLY